MTTQPPVRYATGSYQGSPGKLTRYFWVQVIYPSGRSVLSNLVTIDRAGSIAQSNQITIQWSPIDFALGYDVIETPTSSIPAVNSTANIAVAQGVTSTSIVLRSEPNLASWTYETGNGSSGGAPAGSPGQIQFNAGGSPNVFGASANLSWAANGHSLPNVPGLQISDGTAVPAGFAGYPPGRNFWQGTIDNAAMLSILVNGGGGGGYGIYAALVGGGGAVIDTEAYAGVNSEPLVTANYSLVDANGFTGVDRMTNYWILSPGHSSAATTTIGLYMDDQGGATNPYYLWADADGVRRWRHDSTFDSVSQAIEALYNPLFTKYTPGAANYERVILGQWNGNVAEIGVEKGGTGSLRDLRLIGGNIHTDGRLVTDALTVATLPASPVAGQRAFVTDSNAASFTAGIGAIVAAGGTTKVPVVHDGTNWRIG